MDGVTDRDGESRTEPTPHELVFAICHEVANLLAGIRLEASLLDPDGADAALLMSAARVESASARAGALLATIRPVLDSDSVHVGAVSPHDVLSGLRSGLDASVDARVEVDLTAATDRAVLCLATDSLHRVLVGLIYGALEETSPPARVRVAAESRGAELAFVVHCEGELALADAFPALRGMPLALAVGRRIAGARAQGGRLEVGAGSGVTRVELVFPTRSP